MIVKYKIVLIVSVIFYYTANSCTQYPTKKVGKGQENTVEIYEKTNKKEYYNNLKTITKLENNNNLNPINITIAKLMMDEAKNYYEEAELNRKLAIKTSNFSAKKKCLEKAYNLEIKAIDVQKKAISKLLKKE